MSQINSMTRILFGTLTFFLTAPIIVFGQFGTPPQPGDSGNLLGFILNLDALVRATVPVIAGIALLVFLWGIVLFTGHNEISVLAL